MVKGVNKTIIEINNTESEYFDRILLFVKAEHMSDTAKLDREISKISRTLTSDVRRVPLRKTMQKRKRGIMIAAISVLFVAAISVALTIIL